MNHTFTSVNSQSRVLAALPRWFTALMLSVFGLGICGSTYGADNMNGGPETGPTGTPFTGQVVHVDLEGGFWAIETEQGSKLDPMQLPEQFKRDGAAVQGEYRVLKDVMTSRMWGTPVELLELRLIE